MSSVCRSLATRLLVSLAGGAALACLAAATSIVLGVVPRAPGLLAALLAAAAVLTLVRIVLRARALRDESDLRSTAIPILAFPPESRLDRPRMERTR